MIEANYNVYRWTEETLYTEAYKNGTKTDEFLPE